MALADSIMVLAELCHQPGGGCVRFEGVREGPSHGPVALLVLVVWVEVGK